MSDDTKVVVSGVPFHSTAAPETNPEPETASVISGEPRSAPPGESELSLNTGVVIVKVAVPGRSPSGFATWIVADPGCAIILAGIVVFKFRSLTNVVGKELPFHFTTEPEEKPYPYAFSSKEAPPASAVEGTVWLSPVAPIGKVIPAEASPATSTKSDIPIGSLLPSTAAVMTALNVVESTYVEGSCMYSR
jgi:hypothetical protein